MTTFPLWVERLFLFLDAWLFLFVALALLFKWIEVKVAAVQLKYSLGSTVKHDAANFQERAYLIAFLVWLIVGTIFVYGVGYPMFFYRLRDEAPCLCSYIAQR